MKYPSRPLRLSALHHTRSHTCSLPSLGLFLGSVDRTYLEQQSSIRIGQQEQIRCSRTAAHSACIQRLSGRRTPLRNNWSHLVHRSRSPLLSTSTTAMAGQPLNPAQARGHMGHSHSHGHHHHDTQFLTSSDKNDPGVRITRIGLYVNLGMAIAKFAGGYAFNSKA